MEPILAFITFALVGYSLASTKLINQGNEALVERLGRFHRKLGPGLNFIVPGLDSIVMEDTTREQILDIPPQNVITKDNIYLVADAVVFWQIQEMEKSFYQIDDLREALSNLTATTLRSRIAQMTLQQTIASQNDMSQALLQELDDTTAVWGIKVKRVDIQSIEPPASVKRSMEEQRAAEIRKLATISEAEGRQKAEILQAESIKQSVQIISESLGRNVDGRDILQYLLAQNYVDASSKIGNSPNAKIIFFDPSRQGEMFKGLVGSFEKTPEPEPNTDNGQEIQGDHHDHGGTHDHGDHGGGSHK